ncbi:MAG: hypothetical protein OXN83_01410, partial [Oligoflexia bacterium]|nr:hypothetical protein [Oligoflexia bacterium]
LQNHLEESKIQHRQTLEQSNKNINMQNKMIQYLYSKMSSLEQSIKQPNKNLNNSLNEIKKEKTRGLE